MDTWETWILLQHHLDPGVSKAELLTQFGVSRDAIRRRNGATWLDWGLSLVTLHAAGPLVLRVILRMPHAPVKSIHSSPPPTEAHS